MTVTEGVESKDRVSPTTLPRLYILKDAVLFGVFIVFCFCVFLFVVFSLFAYRAYASLSAGLSVSKNQELNT